MSNYITTHNAEGKAIFSPASAPHHTLPMQPGVDPEVAGLNILYTTYSFPSNLSIDKDIEQYQIDRTTGMAPGQLSQTGTLSMIITMAPDSTAPMHRTMTLDTIIILEGTVELHLDSGETRTMTAGDTIVQRATMHSWKNVSPNGGKVRMMAMAQPIVAPLEVGGKKLETEWMI